MSIDPDRQRIVVLSQDPKTIFSYGLQVKELITGMPYYQFHIISQQYLYGRPFEHDGYVTWAHEGEELRTTHTLKKVINYTNPMCVFSMGDIHHHSGIPIGKPIQVPWVSWFPWDNHDAPALLRAAGTIQTPDVKITMCQFAYDFIKKYNIEIDDWIYNIVDTDVFRPLSVKEYSRKALDRFNPKIKGKKILLFVGRPSWRKNLEFLLSAFKEVCNVRDDVMLYLHVDFDDYGVLEKPNVRKLIHGLNISDNIIYTEENQWTTGVGTMFLNRLYNIADLYISPHGGEGFGLPFCEAMATGTPFVASDCTTMPEFAGDEERGLIAKIKESKMERGIYRPWVDMKDFVDKILWMLENEKERKKMGRRGMFWVKKNCSKKVIVPRWKKIFDKLDVPTCFIDSDAIKIEWSDRYITPEVKE